MKQPGEVEIMRLADAIAQTESAADLPSHLKTVYEQVLDDAAAFRDLWDILNTRAVMAPSAGIKTATIKILLADIAAAFKTITGGVTLLPAGAVPAVSVRGGNEKDAFHTEETHSLASPDLPGTVFNLKLSRERDFIHLHINWRGKPVETVQLLTAGGSESLSAPGSFELQPGRVQLTATRDRGPVELLNINIDKAEQVL